MPSFDIVSKLDAQELDNALDQARKEIAQRFDFKGTGTEVEKTDAGIVLRSESEGEVEESPPGTSSRASSSAGGCPSRPSPAARSSPPGARPSARW